MKYTLRHLDVFLAVARHQSISLAARELAMSQSATSTALQEFENRYNIKLFDRSAKRVRLNANGAYLRAKAEQLMQHAQDFEHELLQHDRAQHLRVGASLTIGNYLAFDYLAKFGNIRPDISVGITLGSSPEIVDKVLNFEVDIGLIEAEIHNSQLTVITWLADNMTVFCSTKHPYAAKKRLNDKDLLNGEWILREPGSAHRQTFDRALTGLLPKLSIRAELIHNEAIKHAVKAGLGLGCLSELAIKDEVNTGTLVPLSLHQRSMRRHFYIVQHKENRASETLDAWVALCQH